MLATEAFIAKTDKMVNAGTPKKSIKKGDFK